ncbi:uncharacterized protein [Amphiura filiformis]|uniref:uncharacterized protein n=1 Tax=Amphiura filiformis TaxID=82378 RepID=UPI003B211374
MVLGDLNARVGSDIATWPCILGNHGRGACNSNGELLLSFCAENQMAVTNTYFQMPDKWYYSWQHPRSKRFHLLDYVLTRQRDICDITSTRVMRGADCSTDHFLVRTICKLHIKPMRRKTKPKLPKKANVRSLIDNLETRAKFQEALTVKLDALRLPKEATINEQWQSLSKATQEVMGEQLSPELSPPLRRNADWFDENNEPIQALLHERTVARNEMLRTGLRSKSRKFKECKSNVQRSLRQMRDEWWNKKAEAVQELAESGNSQAFFTALKEVYGPRHSIASPLLNSSGTTLLTDKDDIKIRWQEHFQDLLNRPSSTAPNVLDNLVKPSSKIGMEKPPTMQEIEDAVKSMKNGKAHGMDGIPS